MRAAIYARYSSARLWWLGLRVSRRDRGAAIEALLHEAMWCGGRSSEEMLVALEGYGLNERAIRWAGLLLEQATMTTRELVARLRRVEKALRGPGKGNE